MLYYYMSARRTRKSLQMIDRDQKATPQTKNSYKFTVKHSCKDTTA